MEASEDTEIEIEILWRQWAPGEWQAILTHRTTREQQRVDNEVHLRQALEELAQVALSVECS